MCILGIKCNFDMKMLQSIQINNDQQSTKIFGTFIFALTLTYFSTTILFF